MAIPYDLTCWYLNARRIIELSGNSLPDNVGAEMIIFRDFTVSID